MGEMYARGMALLPRLVILVPLVLSIIGMVLSALALFAGNQKGFMEEYAIARVSVIFQKYHGRSQVLTSYS